MKLKLNFYYILVVLLVLSSVQSSPTGLQYRFQSLPNQDLNKDGLFLQPEYSRLMNNYEKRANVVKNQFNPALSNNLVDMKTDSKAASTIATTTKNSNINYNPSVNIHSATANNRQYEPVKKFITAQPVKKSITSKSNNDVSKKSISDLLDLTTLFELDRRSSIPTASYKSLESSSPDIASSSLIDQIEENKSTIESILNKRSQIQKADTKAETSGKKSKIEERLSTDNIQTKRDTFNTLDNADISEMTKNDLSWDDDKQNTRELVDDKDDEMNDSEDEDDTNLDDAEDDDKLTEADNDDDDDQNNKRSENDTDEIDEETEDDIMDDNLDDESDDDTAPDSDEDILTENKRNRLAVPKTEDVKKQTAASNNSNKNHITTGLNKQTTKNFNKPTLTSLNKAKLGSINKSPIERLNLKQSSLSKVNGGKILHKKLTIAPSNYVKQVNSRSTTEIDDQSKEHKLRSPVSKNVFNKKVKLGKDLLDAQIKEHSTVA